MNSPPPAASGEPLPAAASFHAQPATPESHDLGSPLVDATHFVLATRESGYRDLASALSELIDNALQAAASRVRIWIGQDAGRDGLRVQVLDNGRGMTADVLARALQFGGSERFGDRSGLGRFGMGLPNSSLSQARRVDVYSWTDSHSALHTWLDLDRLAESVAEGLPRPRPAEFPLPRRVAGCHGTLVVWTHCDRIPSSRLAVLLRRVRSELGRTYRYALWSGVELSLNDARVRPLDPLLIRPGRSGPRARLFGPTLEYPVRTGGPDGSSVIRIRFSEIPVAPWQRRSIAERRRHGIIGGAGVSVVRAGRELDYGWYLMGGKRRENYDDWWRCEISFDPALDELFGVTHSKQGIRPTAALSDLLGPDLEAIARTLNQRVRTQFIRLASQESRASRAALVASRREVYLPSRIVAPVSARPAGQFDYRIEVQDLPTGDFFAIRNRNDTRVIVVNRMHPFYQRLYEPLSNSRDDTARFGLECVLLAAALALGSAAEGPAAAWTSSVTREWSDALATFLS